MGIPRVLAPMLEHFKPMSEWRHEDDYDTLLVYLPGFENIEVTTEDLNIVRVHGGRFTDDGNWSEVNEDYRVPENCEMRGIRSRLDGGILTITMPRKIVNTPPPPPTTTTATQVPPKSDEQTFIRTKQEEPSLPKPKEEPKEKKIVDKPQSTDNTWLDAGKGMHALLEEMSKDGMGQKDDGRGGFHGGDKMEENKKVVARRGMMNEDRKLLVNVGMGVLVIVALGVHVCYTIGLIGKGK